MLDSYAFPQIFFEFFRIFPFFVSEIVFTVFLILFPVFFTILQQINFMDSPPTFLQLNKLIKYL